MALSPEKISEFKQMINTHLSQVSELDVVSTITVNDNGFKFTTVTISIG